MAPALAADSRICGMALAIAWSLVAGISMISMISSKGAQAARSAIRARPLLCHTVHARREGTHVSRCGFHVSDCVVDRLDV